MDEDTFLRNFGEIANSHAQELMKMVCIRVEDTKDALDIAMENGFSTGTIKIVTDAFNSAVGAWQSALAHPQCRNMECDCMVLLYGLGA